MNGIVLIEPPRDPQAAVQAPPLQELPVATRPVSPARAEANASAAPEQAPRVLSPPPPSPASPAFSDPGSPHAFTRFIPRARTPSLFALASEDTRLALDEEDEIPFHTVARVKSAPKTPPRAKTKAETAVIDLTTLRSPMYASPSPPHVLPSYEAVKAGRRTLIARNAVRRVRSRIYLRHGDRKGGEEMSEANDFQLRAPALVTRSDSRGKGKKRREAEEKGGRGGERAKLVFASSSVALAFDGAGL